MGFTTASHCGWWKQAIPAFSMETGAVSAIMAYLLFMLFTLKSTNILHTRPLPLSWFSRTTVIADSCGRGNEGLVLCVCVSVPRGTDGSQRCGDIYLLATLSMLLMTAGAKMNQVEPLRIRYFQAPVLCHKGHCSVQWEETLHYGPKLVVNDHSFVKVLKKRHKNLTFT